MELNRMCRRWMTVWALVAGACIGAGAAAAQTPSSDSLRTALASDDWNERHWALQRINRIPGALPPELVTPVVDLLNREAALRPRPGGEGYGEYVMELVIAAARTDDDRAVRGVIALGGIGVSGAVGQFIARRGPAVFPILDSLAQAGWNARADVIQTYAMMLGRHGDALSRSDSAHVLGILLEAAGAADPTARLQFAFDTPRIPLPEAVPLLRDLASSDTVVGSRGNYPVRRSAQRALTTLEPAWGAEPPATMLERTTVALEGVCAGARGELLGQCEAMAAFLATAQRQWGGPSSQPVLDALRNFRQRVELLETQHLLSHAQAVFLGGNATALIGRLQT